MHFTIIRQIDKLGRIVLPVDIRRFFGLGPGSSVCFTATEDGIILTPAPAAAENSRTMDTLGRIVIPMSVRQRFRLAPHHSLAVCPMEDGIHLKVLSSD